MPLAKKNAFPIIDSRHLKIISAKREQLKNSVVFICLDKEKFGNPQPVDLQSVVQQIDSLEPDGVYFPLWHDVGISFYDKREFHNKDLVVTIKHKNIEQVDTDKLEDTIRQAIPNAKTITFVHQDIEIGW
jgi:hypothetical protein